LGTKHSRMRFKLAITIITFMLWTTTTQSTSKYEGVSWNEKRALWQIDFEFNGKKRKSYFDNEHDATKTMNWIYKKMEILRQNQGISEIPNRPTQDKKSQYKAVYYNKHTCKWSVLVHLKGQKSKYGGSFTDELDAAKRVNQVCEEMNIPLRNPGIIGMSNQEHKKTSQYKGVVWHKSSGRWVVQIFSKGEKNKVWWSF